MYTKSIHSNHITHNSFHIRRQKTLSNSDAGFTTVLIFCTTETVACRIKVMCRIFVSHEVNSWNWHELMEPNRREEWLPHKVLCIRCVILRNTLLYSQSTMRRKSHDVVKWGDFCDQLERGVNLATLLTGATRIPYGNADWEAWRMWQIMAQRGQIESMSNLREIRSLIMRL